VALNAKVSFSSTWDNNHVHYILDNILKPACWARKNNDIKPWIQVSCENPKIWIGAIVQGRGDLDQWVTSIQF